MEVNLATLPSYNTGMPTLQGQQPESLEKKQLTYHLEITKRQHLAYYI